jgi:hypothetical protein
MGQVVVSNAVIMCSFGAAPSTLTAIPKGQPVQAGGQMAATIQDNIPMANIPSFGMCMTPSNPQVAAATAAAMGVLTPQPCIPVIAAPWTPGVPTVMVNNSPMLNNSCQCMCMWGGVITVSFAGQVTVEA